MSKDKKEDKTVVKVKSAKVSVIIIVIVMVLSLACGYFIGKNFNGWKVKEGLVVEQLKKCSELSTAISTQSGSIKLTDGSIPFITKKEFTMSYVANIRTGVDLSDAKTKVSLKKVEVKIPHSEILDISFDEEGLKFYDVSQAIINWRNHNDVKEGLAIARKKVKKDINKSDVLEKADEQVVDTIERLLTFVTEAGYDLIITFE